MPSHLAHLAPRTNKGGMVSYFGRQFLDGVQARSNKKKNFISPQAKDATVKGIVYPNIKTPINYKNIKTLS